MHRGLPEMRGIVAVSVSNYPFHWPPALPGLVTLTQYLIWVFIVSNACCVLLTKIQFIVWVKLFVLNLKMLWQSVISSFINLLYLWYTSTNTAYIIFYQGRNYVSILSIWRKWVRSMCHVLDLGNKGRLEVQNHNFFNNPYINTAPCF